MHQAGTYWTWVKVPGKPVITCISRPKPLQTIIGHRSLSKDISGSEKQWYVMLGVCSSKTHMRKLFITVECDWHVSEIFGHEWGRQDFLQQVWQAHQDILIRGRAWSNIHKKEKVWIGCFNKNLTLIMYFYCYAMHCQGRHVEAW